MKLAKPNFHGHSVRRGKLWLASALINAAIGGTIFQVCYINKKKKTYKDFYAKYDIEKEFETMMEKGLFDSC